MNWRYFFKKGIETKPIPYKVTLPGNIEDPVLDTNSDTWKFMKKFLNDEITSLREKNDKLTLDAGATAAIRGQIKMAKKCLDLEKDGPSKETRSKGLATLVFGAEED